MWEEERARAFYGRASGLWWGDDSSTNPSRYVRRISCETQIAGSVGPGQLELFCGEYANEAN